ncbi:MAG: DUF59 domain-containing protein [Spirochaetia bacterium]|nr:DUF59 domain-containing protein [Spirochaetia bacterium]
MSERAQAQPDSLEEAVWTQVATVEDPEIYMSIVELGLVYDVQVDEHKKAHVKMTLTSMGCPAGPYLLSAVHAAATKVEGITDADVEIVWTPKWDPREMASEEAKMMMGIL